jgi:hypothetical protein
VFYAASVLNENDNCLLMKIFCNNLKSIYCYKIIPALLLPFLSCISLHANDSLYVKKITDTLASSAYFGRGYINDGMAKAGRFISEEMKQIGLEVKEQRFSYSVNTFPGKMSLAINGKELQPGIDFIVAPDSRGVAGTGRLDQSDSVTWINREHKVIISMVDKLTMSVSTGQANFSTFHILKSAIPPTVFTSDVEAKMEKKFSCVNISGIIKGATKPDSIIVFTAHYDHLGGMGAATYFPGANDNAGGVALMLSLAKYYKKHPSPYTIQFIAFGGEEAVLLGSKFYVDHPLLPLKQIRFLINLDLMGNGEEGITVVNATEFPTEFGLLQQLNSQKQLLAAVNSRGKAANSDHYWFTEKGVPSFFIYTLGKRKAYHDVADIAATVPWFEVNDLTELLIDFADGLMRK